MATVSRSIRRYGILITLLITVLASPAAVLASGWSAIASTCTPDDNASPTQGPGGAVTYDFQGAAFQFQPWALSARDGGTVLPITVRCNVGTTLAEGQLHLWQRLFVSYQDFDGKGAGSRVLVHLVRSFRPSGSQVVAMFDSDTHAATGEEVVERSVSFDNMYLDFNTSDYFVEIHLYRTTLASNPRVLLVRLE